MQPFTVIELKDGVHQSGTNQKKSPPASENK